MARIFKVKKSWYIDYKLYGKRIKKAIGRSKRIAELTLSEIERKIARANAREILYSLYEDESNACKICGYDFIVDEHHFISRSQGGSDSPANLVKLCPNHHRLLHLALQTLNNNKGNKQVKEQLERILRIDEDFALFYQQNAAQFEKMKQDKLRS